MDYLMLCFRTTRILDRGIMSRLYRKYKWDTLLRCGSKENKLVPQTAMELTLAYAILSAGACVALLALCLERFTAGNEIRFSWSKNMPVLLPLYVP